MDTSATPGPGLRRAGRAAFIWVVVFIGFHVYWALGGRFGFGDAPTTTPTVHNTVATFFTIVVDLMFVVGTTVPLAIYQRWGRRVSAFRIRRRTPCGPGPASTCTSRSAACCS